MGHAITSHLFSIIILVLFFSVVAGNDGECKSIAFFKSFDITCRKADRSFQFTSTGGESPKLKFEEGTTHPSKKPYSLAFQMIRNEDGSIDYGRCYIDIMFGNYDDGFTTMFYSLDSEQVQMLFGRLYRQLMIHFEFIIGGDCHAKDEGMKPYQILSHTRGSLDVLAHLFKVKSCATDVEVDPATLVFRA